MAKEASVFESPALQDILNKLKISVERHRYLDANVQKDSIETQPVLLVEVYTQNFVTILIQAALNGRIGMYVIQTDPCNPKAILYMKLWPSQVHQIWASKPNEITIPIKFYTGEVRNLNIGFSGLIIDKIEADIFLGDGTHHLEYKIKLLNTQQIMERQKQIQSMSIEMRSSNINARGKEIFVELYEAYKGVKFTIKQVATFMLNEENQIYTSLNEAPPQITSYIKHIRAFKPERSKKK